MLKNADMMEGSLHRVKERKELNSKCVSLSYINHRLQKSVSRKRNNFMDEKVAQIALASKQQSTSHVQISRKDEATAAVTQETTWGTKQIAPVALDIHNLIESLDVLLSQF